MAGTEFWRDLKPIENVFKPRRAARGRTSRRADRRRALLRPAVRDRRLPPAVIQPSQNRWCDILRSTGAGLVNRHYHPQQVFAYTISGKWGYLEHDWVATAGDFVYEAPGEAHTLVAYESDEPMLVTSTSPGPLIWLDENGEPEGTFDVFDYIDALQGALREERHRRRLRRDAVPLIRGRLRPRTARTRPPGGRGPRRRGRPGCPSGRRSRSRRPRGSP